MSDATSVFARPLAFFAPSLRGGGAERVMADLAREAARRGRRVDFVVVNGADAVITDLGPGVRLIDLERRRTAFALGPLLRYLRRERPSAVLATLEHTNVLAVVATRLAGGIRLVLREANTMAEDLAGTAPATRALRAAMRWAYPRADAVVAGSRGVADGLATGLGLAPDRVRVIANPVLTPRVREGAAARPEGGWEDDDVPLILGVGRLVPQKGFDVLLRAFARVRNERDCRLLLLGEGPERAALAALASELGVADHLTMPGYVANPFAHMARCDVFVLASRFEGLPNVLIQALGVGAPVVATDCPSGPNEVLDGGRWGPLVPVDDVDAMAAAIEAVLDAPPPAPDDGWRARYEIGPVTSAYLDVLDGPEASSDAAGSPR